MYEQIFILICLVVALVATLWLYTLKAKKKMKYKDDERWNMVLLKAYENSQITLWLLIGVIIIAQSMLDSQTVFTLDRVICFGLIYIGIHNLIELISIYYFDKQL